MNRVPLNLDHILLGSSDLERGITWVEKQTGVRAALGGVHPGLGTHNALLQLGSHCYLEILAPAPQRMLQVRYANLGLLREPKLVGWAVSPIDSVSLAKRVSAAGFDVSGPDNGSRCCPDGKLLRWRLFRVEDDRGGLLPFFIEWSPESAHPSVDAPSGCRLDRLFLKSPDWQALDRACRDLGVDIEVEVGNEPLLCARISGQKGVIELTS